MSNEAEAAVAAAGDDVVLTNCFHLAGDFRFSVCFYSNQQLFFDLFSSSSSFYIFYSQLRWGRERRGRELEEGRGIDCICPNVDDGENDWK